MKSSNYPIKVSPLTIQALEDFKGRGERVLFYQGQFLKERWYNCSFLDCCFAKINWFSNCLENINFAGCVFQDMNLNFSLLENVSFSKAIMQNSIFTNTNLKGVSFYQAKVNQVNFQKSTWVGVNVYQAEFTNCDFQNVDLQNTNLFECRNLKGSTFNHQTKLPFTKQEALNRGMVFVATHLSIVKEKTTLVANNVIEFPNITKPYPRDELPTPGEVVNLVDYFNPRPIPEGPKTS